ncbi:hypothetical protein [Vibrio coralliilyticus]|uniref:hypothetical protein n=1 Tax=Vibrio coralliilyticus TaxID=190893 RepID=UPI0015611AC1|nr:hypothetical protein [Vibrio coralliilyticus]NRF28925.1 hypothetical protein [Vibrio coralliilyticus]NRF50824.1 hypothetical protein [Vibrio coralliilyticus]NRG05183.1 hypothetical protein [Vibrio coralliilyticus]
MPYITGTFSDGNDYKKLITKRTRVLRMDQEVAKARSTFSSLDLSNLSQVENIEEIIFSFTKILNQEHLNDIAKCMNLKKLHVGTRIDLDFSVLENTNIEELVVYCYCNCDPHQSIMSLQKLKKLSIRFLDIEKEQVASENKKSISHRLGTAVKSLFGLTKKPEPYIPLMHQSLDLLPASIHDLSIDGPVTDFDLADLDHLKLQRLALRRLLECELKFSDEMAKGLEVLTITDCESIGQFSSFPFRNSTRLHTLNFEGTDWSWIDITGFAGLKSLRTVLMRDTTNLYIQDKENTKILSPGWKVFNDVIGEFY